MLKMRWRPGFRHSAWEAHDAPPNPLVGWGGGHPSQAPPPLDLTHRLRRLDSRAYGARFSIRAVPLFETFRRP